MPELKITLVHQDKGVYHETLEYTAPPAAPTTEEGAVTLDPKVLNRCAADPAAYGRALSAALFPEGKLRTAWGLAQPTAGDPVSIRLVLPEDDLALRLVRWETLRNPSTNAAVLTDQGVWFSRRLTSSDARPARLRAKSALRALVAVAAPADLHTLLVGGRAFTADERFAPDQELPAVRKALEGVTRVVTTLPDPAGRRATLKNIADELRSGYDLFYLIAHGVLDGGVPQLLLENDAGNGEVVDGRNLVQEIGQLWHRPALVVLSSCQSAGRVEPFRPPAAGERGGDDDVDPTLGAELGRAGVAAVVSMLGNVYQETARKFARELFAALSADGRIDQAVGAARHAVRNQPDDWAPVLATRETGSRLWRGEEAVSKSWFTGWPALIRQLRQGKCVPVLGSGLLERLAGPTREAAKQWAEQDKVALTPDRQLDLPQVAQYLSITNKRGYVLGRYLEVLTEAVDRRWPGGQAYPPDGDPAVHLLDRLSVAAAADRAGFPAEGHAMFARLNCPLYITTNPDGLLPEALTQAKKTPTEQLCNWLTPPDDPPGPPPDGPSKPTGAAPLVYQLFGHLSDSGSVVLTEDDYFKFLVGMSRANANPTPSFVQQILTRSALLFLGFRINDWDFRAFLHFLLSRQAAKSRKDFGLLDVAVQIDPAEEGAPNAEQARDYLNSLFGRAEIDIEIYWGSVDKFLGELYDQWPATT